MSRLADENSPYLRHAAHQKIDWYPWSEEAFEKARREGKPVFLSSGGIWCHWCHVMARECFENEEIAQLLNEHSVTSNSTVMRDLTLTVYTSRPWLRWDPAEAGRSVWSTGARPYREHVAHAMT